MGFFKDLGNALTGGAASLVGAGINAVSQAATNRTNVQLAREQRQWDLDMWNRQNEYNTPLAQMQRYQEAGINPYMAMGQISSGSATASAGGQSAPQMQAPQPGELIGNAMNDVLNTYNSLQAAKTQEAQRNMIEEQVKALKLENDFQAASYISRLAELRSRSQSTSLGLRFFQDTYKARVQQEENAASIGDYNIKLMEQQLAQQQVQTQIAQQYGLKLTEQQYQTGQQILDKASTEAKMFAFEYENQPLLLQYHLKKLSSEISNNLASAYNLKTQADDIIQTRKSRIKLIDEQGFNAHEQGFNAQQAAYRANHLQNLVFDYVVEDARQTAIHSAVGNMDWNAVDFLSTHGNAPTNGGHLRRVNKRQIWNRDIHQWIGTPINNASDIGSVMLLRKLQL